MNLGGLAIARVDLGFFARKLALMRMPDLRPAWKESRKPLRADQREHAKKQEGPDGAWAPRSSATKVRAASGRKRKRKMLGRLPAALTTRADRRRVIIRSMVAWSNVHNEGGRAGNGASIPQRRFLWASDRVVEVVAGFVAKVVAKAFERA